MAELSIANIAALYIPAPYSGLDNAGLGDTAVEGAMGGLPAEASGMDLPVADLGPIGALGAGADAAGSGLLGGFGGGSPTVIGTPSGGGDVGGIGGGGGGGAGGGSTGTGTTGVTGGTTVIGVPPVTGGGGVAGVPEPSSWALMIIGLAGIGGVVRRRRPGPDTEPEWASNAERRADCFLSRRD